MAKCIAEDRGYKSCEECPLFSYEKIRRCIGECEPKFNEIDMDQKKAVKTVKNIMTLASKMYNMLNCGKYTYNEAICATELCKVWHQVDFINDMRLHHINENKNETKEETPTPDLCAKKLKAKAKSKEMKSKEHDTMFV